MLCNTTDLATLLPKADVLVQHVRSEHADGELTSASGHECLRLAKVLKLHVVQQLLGSQVAAQLQQQVKAAKKGFKANHEPTAAAAAPGLGQPAGGNAAAAAAGVMTARQAAAAAAAGGTLASGLERLIQEQVGHTLPGRQCV